MRAFQQSCPRALLWIAAVALGIPAAAGAQRGTPPASAQRHAPTCAAHLREYKSPADVAAPFDTLQMTLAPVQLSPDEFRPFMLARMAEVGATGFITHETVIDADRTFFQFVPVFVPSDSARIRTACGGRGNLRHE